MSLPAFDPWAALAKLRAEAPPPAKAANPANSPPPAPMPAPAPVLRLANLAALAGGDPAPLEMPPPWRMPVGKQRMPSWADHHDLPQPGDWCGCCRSRAWWAAEVPVLDGTGIGPGWCCAACHPALFDILLIEVRT